ncbi:MAG: hypothetical protein LBV48_00785 [Mycoplasmataceae bacterium]|jgi:hypothetical protein|nr:hypothetical protein [Mycoplasmataceae bacterium]
MNYVALIGIIKTVEKQKLNTHVLLKVQKTVQASNDEKWYEIVKVKIPSTEFKSEITEMKEGDVVGIKGRIAKNEVVAERVQIF